MRFALGCCVACTSTTPAPATTPSEALLVLPDVIVTATNAKVTVRSATHGGVELEAPGPPPSPLRRLEDRGTLVIRHAGQTCEAGVEVEASVAACGDIVISYQQGLVTMFSRDPLHTIGTATVTEGDGACGTRAVSQTVRIRDTMIEFTGYRTVRCIGGGPPAPLIF